MLIFIFSVIFSLTKYDDPYLQGLHQPHHLPHVLCMLIALFNNPSNKLCSLNNFDSSKTTQPIAVASGVLHVRACHSCGL